MPGLYGYSGNANVAVSSTPGLYINSGAAPIITNAQQLLNLLSNNGSVFFQLDPATGYSQVEAFVGNIGGNGSGNLSITLVGAVTGTGATGAPLYTTISNTTVVSGTYGNSKTIPVFTVSSTGQITQVSNVGFDLSTYNGNLTATNFVALGSITAAGNITANNLSTTNKITGGTLSIAGNALISGNATVSGNLTVTGNITYVTTNVLIVNTVVTTLLANATTASINGNTGAIITYGGIGANGNINANGAIGALGNITSASSIVATNGVYSPSYFYSNGQPYAGTYGNANVASYLASNTDSTISNLNANAAVQAVQINTINANVATINANLGAYQIYANANAASQQTQINSLATGANANTASYLLGNTIQGNIQANIVTIGAWGNTYAGGPLPLSGVLKVQGGNDAGFGYGAIFTVQPLNGHDAYGYAYANVSAREASNTGGNPQALGSLSQINLQGNILVPNTLFVGPNPGVSSTSTFINYVSGPTALYTTYNPSAVFEGNVVYNFYNSGTNNKRVYFYSPVLVSGGGGTADILTISGGNLAISGAGSNMYTVSQSGSSGNIYLGAGTAIYGDGSKLTGIVSSYGNANVAAYLPTYTGNITAGNIFTNNYLYSNGVSILTGIGGTYSNANVASYLPVYGGTISVNSISLGNTKIQLGTGAVAGTTSVAIGNNASRDGQGTEAVAIGYLAGAAIQGSYAIAIGSTSGQGQGAQAIAIGRNAATGGQGPNSIAIGSTAGGNMGQYSIAIGLQAGSSAANSSIILNASGSPLTGVNSGLYINPVRNDSGNVTYGVYYNTTTKELTYATGSGGSTYSNTNVAAYLSSGTDATINAINANVGTLYLGNISTNANLGAFQTYANLTFGTSGYSNVNVAAYLTTATISTTGNVTAANLTTGGNLTASYVKGDGSLLTNLPTQTGTYSNANVASYMPVYGGNILAGNVNIPYTSGTRNRGPLAVGGNISAYDTGVIASFIGNESTYLYTSLQNSNSGNTAYSSYALNDDTHTVYGELGINSSTYDYAAAGYPNNAFSKPYATFLQSTGANLAIGTYGNYGISFLVNGQTNTADAMTIANDGNVTVPGNVNIVNTITTGNVKSTNGYFWANGTAYSTASAFTGNLAGSILYDSVNQRWFGNAYPLSTPNATRYQNGFSDYIQTAPTYTNGAVQPPALTGLASRGGTTVGTVRSANIAIQSAYGVGGVKQIVNTFDYMQILGVTANTMNNNDRVRGFLAQLDVNPTGYTWGATGTSGQSATNLAGAGTITQLIGSGTVGHMIGVSGGVNVIPAPNTQANLQYATGSFSVVTLASNVSTCQGNIGYARLFGGALAGFSSNLTVQNAIGLHTYSGWAGTGAVGAANNPIVGRYVVLNEDANTTLQTNGPVTITNPGLLKVSTFTVAALNAVTGSVGQMAAVSDGTGKNNGQLAYWDVTNARWSWVDTNLAVS
jgi:hypothetical protein